jgi:histidyl-tRNA synthetase
MLPFSSNTGVRWMQLTMGDISFDIAGTYDAMIPDAEIITIINEVFENLGWRGKFTIKLNSRKILDGLFEVCGVPVDKIRPISSAVDKLDKSPWYVNVPTA